MQFKQFRKRVFPTLLLRNRTFVKSVNFKNFTYVGNPLNTVQIFNAIGVDEISVLDIDAFKNGIDFKYLEQLASHSFVPLSYGGAIDDVSQASEIIKLGFEKLVFCSAVVDKKYKLIESISNKIGASSVVICLNLKKYPFSKKFGLFDFRSKKINRKISISEINQLIEMGAGEIIIQSVDKDGSWEGFDELLLDLAESWDLKVPFDIMGGVNSVDEIKKHINNPLISAVSISSLCLFQKKNQGVVISFPSDEELCS